MNRSERFTVNRDLIALRVAHGISDRVIDTWTPYVARTPRVMAPVQLDVLMVREGGAPYLECGMKVPAKGTDAAPEPLESLLPEPFTEMIGARERGAYLHWTLPRKMRSGDASTGSIAFPPIPDRWAVLRLSPSQRAQDRRSVRGWILEADAKVPPDHTNLRGWKEPGPHTGMENPLTALGHGDLSWMGYYDNVLNRMSFYDPLTDLHDGPIAYLVCGWYVNAAHDPLADPKIKSLAAFDAKLAQLGWEIPDSQLKRAATHARRSAKIHAALGLSLAATESLGTRPLADAANGDDRYVVEGESRYGKPYVSDGSWWPRQTLFHGSCVGIGWPGVGWTGNENGVLSGEIGLPSPGDISVCFGNTFAEAMGTVVARANGVPDEARVLEAFQLGIVADLDQPDGRARIDAQQHTSTFGSKSGGSRKAPFHRAASGPPEAAKPATTTPRPGVFANRSAAAQRAHHGARHKVSGAQLEGLGSLHVDVGSGAQYAAEHTVFDDGLRSLAGRYLLPDEPKSSPAADIDVDRTLPRFFFPNDPAILIEGAKRSFKFEDEGRFSQNGKLQCRLTGFVMTATKSYMKTVTNPHPGDDTPSIGGDDALETGIENGSVPAECEDLLRETVLLDPGSAVAIAHATARHHTARASALTRLGLATPAPTFAPSVIAETATSVMVEQTVWWSTRDPRVDRGELLGRSNLVGTLPAAIAVTPPARPWAPIHLDWSLDYVPSERGHADWSLHELDYVAEVPALPEAGTLRFTGRSPVTNAAGNALASAIRHAREVLQRSGGTEPLPQTHAHISVPISAQVLELLYRSDREGSTVSELDDIASAIDKVDILSAALDGLHAKLRGGFAPDGISAPGDGAVPSPFVPFRAAFLRFVRLRLVDGFGQFIELLGSGAQTPVDPQRLLLTEATTTTGHPGIAALPPRINTPARLWFRFVSAKDDALEADATHSPLCGFVMPNHLDGALEFFNSDGTNAGMARTRDGERIVWEASPGQQAGIGQDPAATIDDVHAAELAASLLDWGVADRDDPAREHALDALLRVIDSTRWTVDPYGHVGDEHLALLLGHPVAVVRAVVRLELQEPIPSLELQTLALPVRLGALTQWQDGLYGFFADDDYTTLYACDAAVASLARDVGRGRGFLQPITEVAAYAVGFAKDSARKPIVHPYIDTSGTIVLRPDQTVRLTLLVEPHTSIHATSGVLPRKALGLRREWIDEALKKLAPTFRFGPVLVDPKRIKMPVASDIHGVWSWDHRQDAVDWQEQPVTRSTQDATLTPDPPAAQEGWLRLSPPPAAGTPPQ